MQISGIEFEPLSVILSQSKWLKNNAQKVPKRKKLKPGMV